MAWRTTIANASLLLLHETQRSARSCRVTFSLEPLSLAGLALVRSRCFEDSRGYFMETWTRAAFAALGLSSDFVQENQSLSRTVNTLRGLHFQRPPFEQAKLVRVESGKIVDVAVDLRRSSATFSRWCAVTLVAGDGRQIYIPRGFAHGFMALEPDTVVTYKVDAPYAPAHEAGIRWNDRKLGIDWPVEEADIILSERDRNLPELADLVLD
jgi:dTDP-4-dehydrorhamnose 3,5-epimerase